MEDFNLRFPHISHQIFGNLNNQDLTNCRLVRKSWKDCIDGKKILWIRMMEEVGKNIPNFGLDNTVWSRTLRIVSVKSVREIASVIKCRVSEGDLEKLDVRGCKRMGREGSHMKRYRDEEGPRQECWGIGEIGTAT